MGWNKEFGMIFPVIIMAFSLSLDAFGVGMVYGLRKIGIQLTAKLIICFFSVFYSSLSLIAGKSISGFLPVSVSRLIGIIILLFMGCWIIIQAIVNKEKQSQETYPTALEKERKNNAKKETLYKIAFKSLVIYVQIIRNPSECDVDRSGFIDPKEALMLGLVLSVDAIGAGIGSGMSGLHTMLIPVLTSVFQLSFLNLGMFLSKKFILAKMPDKWIISILPGILIIFLAIMRAF